MGFMWRSCGVRVVFVWCSCGVRVVFVWCSCGVRVVFVWCSCGVRVVFVWCLCSVRVVFAWCSCGVRVVLVWCSYSSDDIHVLQCTPSPSCYLVFSIIPYFSLQRHCLALHMCLKVKSMQHHRNICTSRTRYVTMKNVTDMA